MRRRARVDAMATMATMTEPLRVSGLRRLGDEIAHNPPQQGRSADNCADCVSPSWRAAGGGGDLRDLRFRSHASPFPARTIDAIASTVLWLLEFLRSNSDQIAGTAFLCNALATGAEAQIVLDSLLCEKSL